MDTFRFGGTGKVGASRAALVTEDQESGLVASWCGSRSTLSWEDGEEQVSRAVAGVLARGFRYVCFLVLLMMLVVELSFEGGCERGGLRGRTL